MKSLLKRALGANAMALAHLGRARPRAFWNACGAAFEAARKPPADPGQLPPEISVEELLGADVPLISLTAQSHVDGMLPVDQALILLSLLVRESPREVLEIGTYFGHTARRMAEALPTAIIHTVDLPDDFSPQATGPGCSVKDDLHLIRRRRVGQAFKGLPCASRIRQHRADTATWNFSEAGRPTFFFIDGSHTYAQCTRDSQACFELCGGKGVFAWHDCDGEHPGVIRCLAEWRSLDRDVRRIAGTSLAVWRGR